MLQELEGDGLELLWVGGEGGMEEDLVTRAGYAITTLPAAGLHGVGLRALPGNLLQLWRGFFAARRLVAEFQPEVLFFTGGYVAAPVAWAGSRIPTLAFVPDIQPGFALRLVARFADLVAVVGEKSKKYFARPERLRVTGYPLRKELTKWNKGVGRAHFGFKDELPVLLVFGGSKGARSINLALLDLLPKLLKEMQIIHITGTHTWPEVNALLTELPQELSARLRQYPYLHEEMGAALAAADVVLSRAGASALGEFPQFGLPAILVPIPFEKHLQHVNAAYMEKRGAASILKDSELGEKLESTLLALIKDEPRRAEMSLAMSRLANPNAAKQIAGLLRELAGKTQKGAMRA